MTTPEEELEVALATIKFEPEWREVQGDVHIPNGKEICREWFIIGYASAMRDFKKALEE